MYHVVFALIIQAEREREIEEAIRRRQLLRPIDGTTESTEAKDRLSSDTRALTPRARPSGG